MAERRNKAANGRAARNQEEGKISSVGSGSANAQPQSHAITNAVGRSGNQICLHAVRSRLQPATSLPCRGGHHPSASIVVPPTSASRASRTYSPSILRPPSVGYL